MTARWTTGNARPHSSHWGAFSGELRQGRLRVAPYPEDPAPSPLLSNFETALDHKSRVGKPLVRRGWLERGPGPDERRGRDSYIELDWDDAIDLLSAELKRVNESHGPGAIFGGSYGWSSAGRFHHAQSQVHRFLNTVLGGYVRSVNSYSNGAGAVVLQHIVAPLDHITRRNTAWPELAERTEMIVAFGGIPIRNAMVSAGGNSQHVAPQSLRRAAERGVQFVLIGPIRDDLADFVNAQWLPVTPGTDTALMLGIAHSLVSERLHDVAALERFTVGYPQFERYLLGQADGQPKSADWASAICGIAANDIRELARQMASRRTLINISYSLQRAEHGEQPVWMALTLAAMLGQVGLEGGGFMFGLGSIGNVGKAPLAVPLPTLPQGRNNVAAYIPVARIADMLLNPGQAFDYNGSRLVYPDIRLVYWAGGNPFHHHQDLKRLARAFSRPETVVVHEPFFTATTRFADFILPCTMTLERDDIGAAGNDPNIIAMHRLAQPHGEARDDFDIFTALARRLDREQAFTEGRSTRQWLEHLYELTRSALAHRGVNPPSFDEFWEAGELKVPSSSELGTLRAFRADPDKNRLPTPSGRIEITSSTIASFGYEDCLGHPAWLPPTEWLGGARARKFPLHLISNQPAARLHSQLDFGNHSKTLKVAGREKLRIHPDDAKARGIGDEDVVRVFNDRGACLAGVEITTDLRASVVQLSTGAWYDPQEIPGIGEVCAHGNPNVLTRDVGTSSLAQGCAGQHVLVEIERFNAAPPPVRAHEPPAIDALDDKLQVCLAQRKSVR